MRASAGNRSSPPQVSAGLVTQSGSSVAGGGAVAEGAAEALGEVAGDAVGEIAGDAVGAVLTDDDGPVPRRPPRARRARLGRPRNRPIAAPSHRTATGGCRSPVNLSGQLLRDPGRRSRLI